jgi:hypothetical protein
MAYSPDELADLIAGMVSKLDAVLASGLLSATWDIPLRFQSAPEANEVIDFFMVATAFTLKAGMPGSLGLVLTPPEATYIITLKSGGTPAYNTGTTMGTITVSTTGVVTFATAGNVDVVIPVGLYKWVAPATISTNISMLAATVKVSQ